jgi:hypothetical protein
MKGKAVCFSFPPLDDPAMREQYRKTTLFSIYSFCCEMMNHIVYFWPEVPMDPEIAKLLDPARGVHALQVDNPSLRAAEARARELVERASLNEAIRVIDELEQEVASMSIASRFRRDKIPSESPYWRASGFPNPVLRGLNEAEHKRTVLLLILAGLKNKMTNIVGEIEDMVINIEATKTEG